MVSSNASIGTQCPDKPRLLSSPSPYLYIEQIFHGSKFLNHLK